MRPVFACVRRGLVALGVLFLLATPVTAAEQQYSDDKLRAFVAAAVMIGDMSSEWREKIEAAPSEEEANQLREQAGQELAAAIDAADDITLEEYNEISVAARADPELATRIREIYDGEQSN